MNFFILIPLAFFAVNISLIAYLWGKSGSRPEVRAYTLFAGNLALWELAELFLWSNLPDGTIILILRAISPVYMLPGFFLLNFVYAAVSRKRDALYYAFGAIALAGAALSSFTDLLFPDRIIRYHWGTMAEPGILSVPMMLLCVVTPGVISLGFLFNAWRRETMRNRKGQLAMMLYGFLSATALSITTNILFTYLFGRGTVPHLASSLMGLGSVFIFIGIVRYRFLSPAVEDIAADLFSRVHDCVIVFSKDGLAMDMNDAAAAFFGKGRAPGGELRDADIFPSRYTLSGGFRDIEIAVMTAEGERKFLASRSEIGGDRSGSSLVIMKDVTDWMKAESLLRTMEERFSKAFHASPIAMSITTFREGRFVDVNETLVKLTGYAREEYIGKTIYELGTFGTREQFGEYIKALLRDGRVRNFESVTVARDGTVLTGLFFSEIIDIGGEKMIISSAIDITDKKKLEEEMLKTSRIESLGIFAGGIAHDFNNILTAIMGNIALVRMKLQGQDGAVASLLESAESASMRAKDLTRQLLTFSRGGAPQRKAVSITKILRESAEFALSGSKVRCEFTLPAGLLNVEVDENQIGQVMHNIVLNACQAMPGGGLVSIIAENYTACEASGLPLSPGEYVKITVSDTGSGVPEEFIGKIFDPFFSTKAGGSGLGLSVTFSIIKKHGGHVTVRSTQNVGTTFEVYLPATEREPFAAAEKDAVGGRRPLRVLVMDDEPMILTVAKRMLESLGHVADTALGGAEAVARYREARERGEPFDVVLMDLTIPGGMGGAEAVKKIREFDPSVTAIVSSGYSNDPVMANYENYGFSGVVAKPYRLDELREAMDSVIPSRGA